MVMPFQRVEDTRIEQDRRRGAVEPGTGSRAEPPEDDAERLAQVAQDEDDEDVEIEPGTGARAEPTPEEPDRPPPPPPEDVITPPPGIGPQPPEPDPEEQLQERARDIARREAQEALAADLDPEEVLAGVPTESARTTLRQSLEQSTPDQQEALLSQLAGQQASARIQESVRDSARELGLDPDQFDVQAFAREVGAQVQEQRPEVRRRLAEFEATTVQLDTGERVLRQDFEQLSPDQQEQLRRLGVEAFNQQVEAAQQALARIQGFSDPFQAAASGVPPEEFLAAGFAPEDVQRVFGFVQGLGFEDRQQLLSQGVQAVTVPPTPTGLVGERAAAVPAVPTIQLPETALVAGFQTTEAPRQQLVTLSSGEQVAAFEFNRLSPDDQALLRSVGVEGFNRIQQRRADLIRQRRERAEAVLSRFADPVQAIANQVSLSTLVDAGFSPEDVQRVEQSIQRLSGGQQRLLRERGLEALQGSQRLEFLEGLPPPPDQDQRSISSGAFIGGLGVLALAEPTPAGELALAAALLGLGAAAALGIGSSREQIREVVSDARGLLGELGERGFLPGPERVQGPAPRTEFPGRAPDIPTTGGFPAPVPTPPSGTEFPGRAPEIATLFEAAASLVDAQEQAKETAEAAPPQVDPDASRKIAEAIARGDTETARRLLEGLGEALGRAEDTGQARRYRDSLRRAIEDFERRMQVLRQARQSLVASGGISPVPQSNPVVQAALAAAGTALQRGEDPTQAAQAAQSAAQAAEAQQAALAAPSTVAGTQATPATGQTVQPTVAAQPGATVQPITAAQVSPVTGPGVVPSVGPGVQPITAPTPVTAVSPVSATGVSPLTGSAATTITPRLTRVVPRTGRIPPRFGRPRLPSPDVQPPLVGGAGREQPPPVAWKQGGAVWIRVDPPYEPPNFSFPRARPTGVRAFRSAREAFDFVRARTELSPAALDRWAQFFEAASSGQEIRRPAPEPVMTDAAPVPQAVDSPHNDGTGIDESITASLQSDRQAIRSQSEELAGRVQRARERRQAAWDSVAQQARAEMTEIVGEVSEIRDAGADSRSQRRDEVERTQEQARQEMARLFGRDAPKRRKKAGGTLPRVRITRARPKPTVPGSTQVDF